MSGAALTPSVAASVPVATETRAQLLRQTLALAMPVLAEQVLNAAVGLNDTFLANHLPQNAADAGAAVATIGYIIWFFALVASAVGTGSSAIIARAKGARHKSMANNVTGQSIGAAVVVGLGLGTVIFIEARPIVAMTQLHGQAGTFALSYLRMLSWSLPATMVMMIANACLRGGGDTLTPAIAMILLNIVNMVFSFALCRGWWGFPVMGFEGIAVGTIIAYVLGGALQFIVLCVGTRGARLYLHRLRPHWHTIKRLLRIGLPAGAEQMLIWPAQFAVMFIINRADPTSVMAAAHINTVRLESISFLWGIAFSTAAATLVGIRLGRKDPVAAARCAWIAFTIGAIVMTFMGILMITLGQYPADWLSGHNPRIAELTAHCLRITGFAQIGFAGSLILSGAMRGAGDTLAVMVLNTGSILALRFPGVVIVGLWLNLGLEAIWVVLAAELMIRGTLVWARFLRGKWKTVTV